MVDFAYCKINLGLNILRRRDDGYHEIETIMLRAPWCDIVEIVPSKSPVDTLHISGRYVDCPPEKNLVIRTVNAMRALIHIPPVDIYLHKVVPDGAGLGGGSSDAGTTAKIVNKLFALGFSQNKLAQILAQIGSDCPFFAYDTPMLCTGTGTTMKAISVPTLPNHIVIAKHEDCAISTAAAYAGVNPNPDALPLCDILAADVQTWRNNLKNDFEKSIFSISPKVKELKEKMYETGAVYAAMSGSGAAVFGLFDKLPENIPQQLGTSTYISAPFSSKIH